LYEGTEEDRVYGPINGFTNAEEYSPDLVKKMKRKKRRTNRQKLTNRVLNLERQSLEDEDGYQDLMRPGRSFVRRVMRVPFQLVKRIVFPEISNSPGTLILVRHGESVWNYNKTFTGWADPDLSERGEREVEHAARLLLEGGYDIDVVFTSRLTRAIRSTWIILQELNKVYIPVFKSWRLNERMYGALTGLSKTETAAQLGAELVQEWRGSLRSRPPSLKPTDKHWPGRDRKHFDLSSSQLPLTESLLDCMERTAPVWEDKISYELRRGRNVLVVAHANTLRGLVKTIDNIGDAEIQEVAIPTGIPVVYKFDNIKTLNSIPTQSSTTAGSANQLHMNGLFLEKPGLLKEALKLEKEWCDSVPGYGSMMAKDKVPMTALERSLSKLKAERELGEWAGNFIDTSVSEEDDGDDGNGSFLQDTTENNDQSYTDVKNGGEDASKPILAEDVEDSVAPTLITNNPCQIPSVSEGSPATRSEVRQEPVIVIIRHGKTEHNKLGLFTGWEDAPLAPEGVEEARLAGKLLKSHNYEFDVVYTSWLSRATHTAWLVLDELGDIWLPIIKTWRLNERMYGALTGLSKKMVKQRHGEKQFKAWRRGYKVRPPKVSSFSPDYPGNDVRYKKFMKDVRYSVSETLIRSIEAKKLQIHRKYPKSESLKDCMDRTIPYFIQQIEKEAFENRKRVLVASSENAIRGLLMHLCDIPEEEIVGLEIPNGLPLIFDVKSKCVKLLDDGSGRDPLETYSFGKAANYLFRPCFNEDGTLDEECDINFMSGDSISEKDDEIIRLVKGPKVASY